MRRAGARVDEDVAFGIGRDAGRFPEVNVVGKLQQIGVGFEGNLGGRRLREDRAGAGDGGGSDEELE
jgi:hypothetical protein